MLALWQGKGPRQYMQPLSPTCRRPRRYRRRSIKFLRMPAMEAGLRQVVLARDCFSLRSWPVARAEMATDQRPALDTQQDGQGLARASQPMGSPRKFSMAPTKIFLRWSFLCDLAAVSGIHAFPTAGLSLPSLGAPAAGKDGSHERYAPLCAPRQARHGGLLPLPKPILNPGARPVEGSATQTARTARVME